MGTFGRSLLAGTNVGLRDIDFPANKVGVTAINTAQRSLSLRYEDIQLGK
jgi:hypothetical protein